MIMRLFRKDPRRAIIAVLYERVATAARAPGLYLALGVPDTLEGRFEALALHVALILRALRGWPEPAGDVARDLAEALFSHLDATLREMGVGDTAVPKRIRPLAEAFYGRAQAYDGPLDRGDEALLAESLGRNVLGRGDPAEALARYAIAADRRLAEQDLDSLLRQGPNFPDPEAFATGNPP
jgi:cytochrome b pre-mRNA-processing protein 3